MKQKLIDKWNEIKTSVVNKITEMKEGVVNKFNEIKNSISNIINNIKSTLSTWGNNIKTTISNAFSTVYETITSPFKRAWSYISGIGDKISGVISKINPFKNLFRTIDTTIMPTVNTGGIAPLSLDNIALSGSYYTATTRDSLGATDMIRKTNRLSNGISTMNQSDALDNITKQFTQEIANMKAENNTMMNVLVATLNTMTKAMQEYVLQDHIEIKNNLEIENTVHYNPKKMANSISPYMDKSVGRYNKLAMR